MKDTRAKTSFVDTNALSNDSISATLCVSETLPTIRVS